MRKDKIDRKKLKEKDFSTISDVKFKRVKKTAERKKRKAELFGEEKDSTASEKINLADKNSFGERKKVKKKPEKKIKKRIPLRKKIIDFLKKKNRRRRKIRENEENRRILGAYREKYVLSGGNFNVLLNGLARRGVEVQKFRKTADKKGEITIKATDREKFFAITEELWYTDITKIKNEGRWLFVEKLLRSFGLVVGGALFIAIGVVSDDFVYGIEFTGDGKYLAPEVREYLKDEGVSEFSRFSDLDMKRLSADILAERNDLTFVSCKKQGNRLVILLTPKEEGGKILSGTKTLSSDCDGVVESVKVYRGTAVVAVGQRVSVGDALVEGYATVNEKIVPLDVIASVSVVTESRFLYESDREDLSDAFSAFAVEESCEDPFSVSAQVSATDGGFLYEIVVKTRRIIRS